MTVLQTSGRRWAIIAGALTLVSYVVTAAVSALAAAYYLSSVCGSLPPVLLAATASFAIILFALLRARSKHESSGLVLAVSAIHFAILIGMDLWGLVLMWRNQLTFAHIGSALQQTTVVGLVQGTATAFLGISGFESAAQLVEQLKHPRWVTLRKVYSAIIVLVLLTAPLTSALCLTLLSSAEITTYRDNLLSGLALVEGGRTLLYVLVIDALCVLLAAVNTAYIGAIGLCLTMARQGDLPAQFLREEINGKSGHSQIVLLFMVVSLVTTILFATNLDRLGEIYCIAFLGIMLAYSIGVILMHVKYPSKVRKAEIGSPTKMVLGKADVPVHAVAAVGILSTALITLSVTSVTSALSALYLFIAILVLMLLYRVGVMERRIMEHPDLNLGLGKFADLRTLPKLPAYVVCTGGANAANLITRVVQTVQILRSAPAQIIILHAELEGSSPATDLMFELLQRVVSQQVAPRFQDKDLVLTVKVVPTSLSDGLLMLQKAIPFEQVFLGTPEDSSRARKLIEELKLHLRVPVAFLDEIEIPALQSKEEKNRLQDGESEATPALTLDLGDSHLQMMNLNSGSLSHRNAERTVAQDDSKKTGESEE